MSPSIPIPEGSVVITPFQMYQEQQATHTAMLGVSSKLDSLVEKIGHVQEDQSKRMEAIDGKDGVLANHGRRLDSLERWRWLATGAVAMLSSGGTAAVFELFAATRH